MMLVNWHFNMFSSLKRWLYHKLKNEFDNQPERLPNLIVQPREDDDDLWSSVGRRAITFKILSANGGLIFCARNYDDRRDEWDYSTHIIPDNVDYGNAIYNCINIEMLKAKN